MGVRFGDRGNCKLPPLPLNVLNGAHFIPLVQTWPLKPKTVIFIVRCDLWGPGNFSARKCWKPSRFFFSPGWRHLFENKRYNQIDRLSLRGKELQKLYLGRLPFFTFCKLQTSRFLCYLFCGIPVSFLIYTFCHRLQISILTRGQIMMPASSSKNSVVVFFATRKSLRGRNAITKPGKRALPRFRSLKSLRSSISCCDDNRRRVVTKLLPQSLCQ